MNEEQLALIKEEDLPREEDFSPAERLELKETGFAGGKDVPKFQWDAIYEGQANYIQLRCEELGLKTHCVGQTIMVFSKTKLELLLKVIEESTKFLYQPQPVLVQENLVCKQKNTLLGVMIKSNGFCYTTDAHFKDLKYHIYKKEIPNPTKYIVFATYKDLCLALASKERLYV